MINDKGGSQSSDLLRPAVSRGTRTIGLLILFLYLIQESFVISCQAATLLRHFPRIRADLRTHEKNTSDLFFGLCAANAFEPARCHRQTYLAHQMMLETTGTICKRSR